MHLNGLKASEFLRQVFGKVTGQAEDPRQQILEGEEQDDEFRVSQDMFGVMKM